MAAATMPAPPTAEHVNTEGAPFTEVCLTAPPPAPIPALRYGPVGWAAIDVAPPWAQIGRYAQPIPTQYPVNIPGVQLRQGVEDLDPRWSQPSRSATPTWQQTQKPANIAGAQRWGKSFSGQEGGILGAAQANALLANQIAFASGNTASPGVGVSNIVAAEHLMGSAAY